MAILKHWENVAKKHALCFDLGEKKKKNIKSKIHAVFVSISDSL